MKKTRFLRLAALALLTVLLLTGCSGKEYTIGFDACGGTGAPAAQTVRSGKTIAAADAPARDGYVFLGWYQDENWTQPWNAASDKVVSDLTLYAGWNRAADGAVETPAGDKDFSMLRTPGSQEDAYVYSAFFRPAKDGGSQPCVGDPMPYYEDGVYYIYYLKEAGDAYNHSIYLVTTQDFVTYTENEAPVLGLPVPAARTAGSARGPW